MPERKAASQSEGNDEDQGANRQPLPDVKVGQTLWSGEPQVDEKHTQPPEPFTDATLLAAMTGINRYVQNRELKKILKDTDGLGTEATRASIIELLFKRQFLQRQGKQIRATPLGRALINALPEQTTVPDMTAQWERQLNDISERALNYDGFMQPMLNELGLLVGQAGKLDISAFQGLPAAAKTAGKSQFKRRGGRRASQAAAGKSTTARSASSAKSAAGKSTSRRKTQGST